MDAGSPPFFGTDGVGGVRPNLRTAVMILLAIGVALRVWQYVADMSFWLDELSLARNIDERSFAELMIRPLGYDQIAPLGFLALIKLSAIVAGPSDRALRIVPFVAGVVALFLFALLAARTLEGVAVPLSVCLFAIGAPLIRYSAELKQYGTDVVAILALTLLALDLMCHAPTVRRCVICGAAGVVIAWFSQSSLMVMAGLGGVLIIHWLRVRTPHTRRPVVITVPMWTIGSVVALRESIHHTTPETLAYMHRFWGQRQSFFPMPPRHLSDARWLWDRVVQLVGSDGMLAYPWPQLYTGLALIGLIALWRRRRAVALVVVAPFAITVAAAVAQQYPFRMRVVFFLIPTLILWIAAAVQWIATSAARIQPLLGAPVVILALTGPLYSALAHPPPYYVEGYKPVLAFVQAHRRPGDAVYVFANALPAIDRYGRTYGIERGDYLEGICEQHDNRAYLRDADRLRGAPRAWYIASSVPPYFPPRHSIDRYLHAIGVAGDSIVVQSHQNLLPVSAQLFDLSDTVRLRRISASAFDVTPIIDTLPPECNSRIFPSP